MATKVTNFSNAHNHIKNRGKVKQAPASGSTKTMTPKKPTVLNLNSTIKY